MLWKAAKPSRARRRQVAERLRPGPARLAHRVLGDVHARCSARHFDIHGGGAGPAVPAPRERDRPERGRERPAVRATLDAQRLRQHRQREDVEVARQLLHHPRRAEALRRARRCASSCCARTTAARSTSATRTSTTRAARCARLYTALDAVRAGERRQLDWNEPHAAAFPRGDERRLQHADRGGRCCSSSPPR